MQENKHVGKRKDVITNRNLFRNVAPKDLLVFLI